MKSIKVQVKFYFGARESFPSLNYAYRPHFVVEGDDEMLGIEFLKSDLKEYGVFGEAVVKPLFENVGYHKLKKGVYFRIVEGTTTVGKGYVLE